MARTGGRCLIEGVEGWNIRVDLEPGFLVWLWAARSGAWIDNLDIYKMSRRECFSADHFVKTLHTKIMIILSEQH